MKQLRMTNCILAYYHCSTWIWLFKMYKWLPLPGKFCVWREDFFHCVASLSKSYISIFSWNGGVPHLLKFRLLLLVKLVAVKRYYCNANCRRYQPVEELKEQRQRGWGNFCIFSNSHLEYFLQFWLTFRKQEDVLRGKL